jgi:hypothetical protein
VLPPVPVGREHTKECPPECDVTHAHPLVLLHQGPVRLKDVQDAGPPGLWEQKRCEQEDNPWQYMQQLEEQLAISIS